MICQFGCWTEKQRRKQKQFEFSFPSPWQMRDFCCWWAQYYIWFECSISFSGLFKKTKEDWHWNTVSEFWDVRCLACYSFTSSGIYAKWCSINGRDLSLSQGVLGLFNTCVSISFSQKGELNAHFLLPGWVLNFQANEGKQMILRCRAALYHFLSTTFQQILLKFLNSCRSANDHHWGKKNASNKSRQL